MADYGITNAGGGSASLGTKTITSNNTYSAATDGLDGYSEVTVNVPSGATVTVTNKTGEAVASGERVYIISNNNLTLVPQLSFNPLISWTGIAAANIAGGATGPVMTNMTVPASGLNVYDRVGGAATVFMIYTDDLGVKYAACLLDAVFRNGPTAFGSNGFDLTVMTTFGATSEAIANARNSLVSATSQKGALINAGTLNKSPAMVYCNALRNTIDGVEYRALLPTVKELDAIYADRLALDALDPTVAQYPAKSLSNWNLGNDSGRVSGIYTCCPAGSGSYVIMIKEDGAAYCSTDSYMTVKHGIMPIIEIPIV